MIRTRALVVALCVIVLTFVLENRLVTLWVENAQTDITIALAYDPDEKTEAASESREAYTEVLREEGIPASWISTEDLFLLDTKMMAARYRAVLFPDGMNRNVSEGLSDVMRRYADAGGTVAVIYDAGSRDRRNEFIARGSFSSLLGVDYSLFSSSRPSLRLHPQGNMAFTSSNEAGFWSFPPGKIDGKNTLAGYHYGPLSYPMLRAHVESQDFHMSAHSAQDEVLGVRRIGRGSAIWVNLPLGYLKSYGDDLPLRSIVRSIARRFAQMPYLIPVPWGIGTAIISWHVDSGVERRGVPNLLNHGIIRRGIHMEFDVTAGPDRDRPGDGMGLDACGRGSSIVKVLSRYGTIGSHGGWAHNWFVNQILSGSFSADQIERFTLKNNRCLEKVTGRRVISYAAPSGVHPQTVMTRVLEKIGTTSYYYTGDTGAPPNRTFYNGHMVSQSVWAYPVMPYRQYASLGEMRSMRVSPEAVRHYLVETKNYIRDQHSVALIYSHPYDLLYAPYVKPYRSFIDGVQKDVKAGTLQTMSMSEYTEFARRFIQTTFSVQQASGGWRASIANPMGLNAVSFALPNWLTLSSAQPFLRIVGRSREYTSYAVTANIRQAYLPLQIHDSSRDGREN